jgi:hypothetical protein
MPEKVAYAMSRNIDGPWEFKGILNELAGNCETNRPCIVDFKGKSYFFITMVVWNMVEAIGALFSLTTYTTMMTAL